MVGLVVMIAGAFVAFGVVGHLRKLFGLLETELAYESSLLFMMWKTAFILVFY